VDSNCCEIKVFAYASAMLNHVAIGDNDEVPRPICSPKEWNSPIRDEKSPARLGTALSVYQIGT
jgi:hypothetical protein